LATSLVDNREDDIKESEENEEGLVITITTHPDEVGKVIGRGGRTIKSIRTLARAIAGQGGCQVEVNN
ncbi:MAG: KH domain-containing protein, partial [Actinomycetia bacterium]|nr:KH domain-containing protein [Actinomycetes bacterium]